MSIVNEFGAFYKGIINDSGLDTSVLNFTGLSDGVVKCLSGVLTGSATTTDLPEGSNLYYTSSRFDSAFSTKTTSNLTEGTNLYYTDARARAAISESNANLTYNSSTGVLGFSSTPSFTSIALGTASPAFDITIERGNGYQWFNTQNTFSSVNFGLVSGIDCTLAVTASESYVGNTTSGNFSLRTAGINRLTVDSSGNINMPNTVTIGSLSGVLKASTGVISGSATTTDLTEGSNLYFTNARAISAFSAGTGIGLSSGVISNSGVLSAIGTSNQVLINGTTGSSQTGAITLTLPQSIGTGSSPTFTGLTVGTLNGLIKGASGVLSAAASTDYVASITGTSNQIIASSSTGAITLTLPQSIATSSTVQFGNVYVGASALTSSTAKLQITGNIEYAWDTVTNYVRYQPAPTLYYGGWDWDASGRDLNLVAVGADGDPSIYFKTGTTATSRMVINGSGNVGIGCAPVSPLTVTSGSYGPCTSYANYKLLGFDAGTAAASYGIGVDSSTLWFNSTSFHRFYNGSNLLLSVGSAYPTSGSYLVFDGSNTVIGSKTGDLYINYAGTSSGITRFYSNFTSLGYWDTTQLSLSTPIYHDNAKPHYWRDSTGVYSSSRGSAIFKWTSNDMYYDCNENAVHYFRSNAGTFCMAIAAGQNVSYVPMVCNSTLNVSLATTLSSTLAVTGTSTLTGAVTIGGVAQIPYACYAGLTNLTGATQSIGVPAKVTVLDTSYAANNMTADTTNKRLTCTVAGKYRISFNSTVSQASGATRKFSCYYYKNGAARTIYSTTTLATGVENNIFHLEVIDLAVNDYVELYANSDTGTQTYTFIIPLLLSERIGA